MYNKVETEAKERYAGHKAKTIINALQTYYDMLNPSRPSKPSTVVLYQPRPNPQPQQGKAYSLDSLKNAFPESLRSRLKFEDAGSKIKVSKVGYLVDADFDLYRSIMKQFNSELVPFDRTTGTNGYYLVSKMDGSEP